MAEHFDVIIVGAGLSGIGAAKHLQDRCPGKRYVILEGRDTMGGTWDLFRYPGVRSDSDMHTLGYCFKPWIDRKAIAEGPAIRRYIRETAAENDIAPQIRYRHRVLAAHWSTADSCWTLSVAAGSAANRVALRCNFLLMCAGYYSYRNGYCPEFAGRETFGGTIVHPQHWPQDLDYQGKRVVVIGSGATAVTLVPAMAARARLVTMLQRSPTYMINRPWEDALANFLRKVLPESWAYALTRYKNVTLQLELYRRTRTHPRRVRDYLLNHVRRQLGPDYDVDRHFSPSYNPWDQRLCLVPDNDLFVALREGRAEIVTDHIDRFTETGIQLRSGRKLNADIIVTATGLNLAVMGEMEIRVDGEIIDFSRTWSYRGLMISGVPNLVVTFGYINASWTLRADLIAEWSCRVINHLDASGNRRALPVMSAHQAATMPKRPWIDNFSSGYMQRGLHALPRQGDREPWLNPQDYGRDRKLLRNAVLEDGYLHFSNPDNEAPMTRPSPMSTAVSASSAG